MTSTNAAPGRMGEPEAVSFRPGTPADSYAVFTVFERSLADLVQRFGLAASSSADDPAALARMWEERRSLYEHLAETFEHFWVAERDGQAIGYSRSILRDGVRSLTELFVAPDAQAAGLGRELITRAFPAEGAGQRFIISSPDLPAQILYLKAGVYARFPLYYLWRQPEAVPLDSRLSWEAISASQGILAMLGEIDAEIIGHRRDADHSWLLADRQGYLYRRNGRPVGYGYVGKRSGPFALLDEGDYPAVLAHAESAAAERYEHFGLELPGTNGAALEWLLSRRFRIERFVATFMSSEPFGKFENYVVTSPPFII